MLEFLSKIFTSPSQEQIDAAQNIPNVDPGAMLGTGTTETPVISQTEERARAIRPPPLLSAVAVTEKLEEITPEQIRQSDIRTGQAQASASHNAALNQLADVHVPVDGERENRFDPRTLVEPKIEGALDQGRVKYADLKALFQNKFLPNELYINKDETSGYNLTAYNITLFALPEAVLLGAKINQVAANGLHHYQESAIIIAQSAGSDEFYIDGLEFDSIIGRAPDEGTGSPPKNISITIKAPTSSDFIDQLMKVAIVGGWKNHISMPLFIHIEWKARDIDTDAMVTQVPGAAFRCFGLYLRKLGGSASPMTIALDEGGSTMVLGANGFTRQSANNQVGRVHEGLTVDGFTVGEILGKIALEMYKLETSGKDNSIVPDEIYITFPKEDGTGINEIRDWEMVVGKSEFFSSVTSAANPNKNTSGTEGTPSATKTITAVASSPSSSDSTYIKKPAAFADLKKSTKKVTYTAKEGDSLVEAIIKVCSNTKRAQELISGITDAQSPDAVKDKKKVDPTDIARKFIIITSDIELIGYDPGRRMYASKHFIKIFLQNGVSWSEAEQITTTQDKKVSTERLFKMLSENYIRKCYHHIHTGLNTEVISVDYTFDKTLMYSGQLYSGVVAGFQNRQHGTQLGTANDGASHLGLAGDKELNQKRVLDEINKEAAVAVAATEEKLVKLGTAENVPAGGPPGTQEMAISRRIAEQQALERELAIKIAKADELARLAKEENFIALQTGTGATNVTTRFAAKGPGGRGGNIFTVAEQVQFRTAFALTPNQKAFMQPDGRIKIITWDPAPEKDVIVNGGRPLYIKDINEEIIIKAMEQGVMFPVQFGSTRLAQDNQGGMRVDYTKGKNVFAEIYNNRKIEMMTLDLTIRGDPYWIPITQKDNGDRSVSPEIRENYLIIISDQANTWDPNTGIMVLNQRNSLNGVYLVKEVKHSFAGGEFKQDLSCVRGTSIDLNAMFGGLSLSDAVQVDAKLRNDTGVGLQAHIFKSEMHAIYPEENETNERH